MRSAFTLLFFFGAVGTSFAQLVQFDLMEPQPDLSGALFGDVAFADIDNDGDNDLFLCGREAGWTSLARSIMYLNDGTGVFTEDTSNEIENLESASADFADFDNDGDQDLLVTGMKQGSISFAGLYLNDGQGQFALDPNTTILPCQDGDFTIGDVDGDGDQDVFMTGTDGPAGDPLVKLYTNDGQASFTETSMPDDGLVNLRSVEFVDLDGDTDLDVVALGVIGDEEAVTKTYINDGSANFTEGASGIPNFSNPSFAIGDLDNDGDGDVLISGAKEGAEIIAELYLNDGSGTFSLSENSSVFPALFSGKTSFADFDLDGDLDVIMTGSGDGGLGSETGIISMPLENLGNNNFLQTEVLIGSYASTLAVGDINGDDLLDLVISGTTVGDPTFKTWVYRNNSEIIFSVSEDQSSNGFALYPNPSNGQVTLATLNPQGSSIEIYSMTGALVHTEAIRNTTTQLDLNLADGLYTLVLRNGTQTEEQKLSVIR